MLSTLKLNAPNVLVVEARPLRSGTGLFLHLREVEGRSVTLTEADVESWSELAGVHEANVLEETIREDIDSLTLAPYEVRFVKLVTTPAHRTTGAAPGDSAGVASRSPSAPGITPLP